jgi:hypothetical protein
MINYFGPCSRALHTIGLVFLDDIHFSFLHRCQSCFRSMIATIGLLFAGLFAAAACANASLHDNSAQCDCYITDGLSSEYYLYHRFFDFRTFSGQYGQEPANVTDSQDEGLESTQSGYLSSTSFTNDWEIRHWGRNASSSAPVDMQYSAQNVYIGRKLQCSQLL